MAKLNDELNKPINRVESKIVRYLIVTFIIPLMVGISIIEHLYLAIKEAVQVTIASYKGPKTNIKKISAKDMVFLEVERDIRNGKSTIIDALKERGVSYSDYNDYIKRTKDE